jgi:hypothetical protein
MAIDLTNLRNKVENNGENDQGVLRASDFNNLVQAVIDNQTAVNGSIKAIKYNNVEYRNVVDGVLEMNVYDTSSRNVKFEWLNGSGRNPKHITKTSTCYLEFNVIDEQPDTEDPSKMTSYTNPGTVKFYTVQGTTKREIHSISNVYDKKFYASTGPIKYNLNENFRLGTLTEGNTILVEYTNNGVSIAETFTVYVYDVSISVRDAEQIYTSENPPKFTAVVSGSGANLYVEVDDKGQIVQGLPVSENANTIIKDQLALVNTHGTHTIKIWAEKSINDNAGTVITTNVLAFNYIYGDSSNNRSLVMSTITDGQTFSEYNKLPLEYIAYSAGNNGMKDINIRIVDENNTPLLSTTQQVEFKNGCGSGSYTFVLFPKDGVELAGSRKLIISIDGTAHETSIEILENPNASFGSVEDYAVYLSSVGRSNDESTDTRRVWDCKSKEASTAGQTFGVTFDDNVEFTKTGSGWIADKDGNIAMHLRKGKFFTLNYKPFEKNPCYSGSGDNGTKQGLTISVEFATRNCLKDNAAVIDCMEYDENGNCEKGLLVTASSAKLKGSDIELNAKFKEETRIKLDIVIEGTTQHYTYDTMVLEDGKDEQTPMKGESDECLALMFIDGVYTGIKLVTNQTTFRQGLKLGTTAKEIRFGSNDCDLDIYNIRIYNRALNIDEVVKNYAYDTPVLEDKIAISSRNDIFNSPQNNRPNIEVSKLSAAREHLPLLFITMDPEKNVGEVLPQDKSNWRLLSDTRFENPTAKAGKQDEALTSFQVLTGVIRNQGTSSMTYPWPWRNWDWKTGDTDFAPTTDKDAYKNTFKFYLPDYTTALSNGGSDNTPKVWLQYPYTGGYNKILGIKKITLKKDYASSEMCNNAICSELFTDMAIGVASSFNEVLSPTMKKEYDAGSTNLRLSLKAKPCFMFRYYNDSTKPGTAGNGIEAMGMMNLIPNKNEVGYLGFTKNCWENADELKENMTATEIANINEKGWPGIYRQQSWELADNKDDIFWVKKFTQVFDNSDTNNIIWQNDLDDNYEARTPKDSSVLKDKDFGFGTPKTLEEAKKVMDEGKDIIDFHNWLVDTNQYLADNSELYQDGLEDNDFWNYKNYDGTTAKGSGERKYTHNTREYRKAKFMAEAPYRLLIDQWILYYIWREQFWMFDSGFKNLQMYTMGPAEDSVTKFKAENGANLHQEILQWGCMVRDADTALGIENTGKDYFPPHIEDCDYYTESNGVITFVYNQAKDIYDIQELEKIYGENATPVLNGQFGSIWRNLRDCYSSEIERMYRALINSSTSNFGSFATINKFRAHQEEWCESLYNFGMRQYFGGQPFSEFNKSGLGDKKNSRAAWLEKGFYYRMGKYRCLNDSTALRVNKYTTPDGEFDSLEVKTYIPMYFGCGGATADMINCKNVIRMIDDTYLDGSYGKPISVGETGFNFPAAGDAVSYMYGTNNITSLGDIARVCKINRIQTLNFPKLRELTLGHESSRDGVTYREYEPSYYYIKNDAIETNITKTSNINEAMKDNDGNPIFYLIKTGEDGNNIAIWFNKELNSYVENGGRKEIASTTGSSREFRNEILQSIDCSSLSQLTLLDVTNHTNLSSITIKDCDQLQKLYAKGTICQSIELPKTTALETVYLGKELTSLVLDNLTGIKDLQIESLAKCSYLEIVKCGDYVMGDCSKSLVESALATLKSVYNPGVNEDYCILNGINWTDVDENWFMELVSIYNTNNAGNLKGTVNLKSLSYDNKIKLMSIFGDIDYNDPSSGLHVTYKMANIGTISVKSNIFLTSTGEHLMMFNPSNPNGNNFISFTWHFSEIQNNDVAEDKYKADITTYPESGIIVVNKLGHEKYAQYITAKVTVEYIDLLTKEVVSYTSSEMKVNLYYRSAKIGDIVYHDGTYSSPEDYENAKSVIGVCFYIEPLSEEQINAGEEPLRLMVAMNNVNISSSTWGIQRNTNTDGTINGISGIEIEEDNTINAYNIKNVPNYSSSNLYTNPIVNNFNFESFRNTSDVDANGWTKLYDCAGAEIGYKVLKANEAIRHTNFVYAENDKVPFGKYYTDAIIYSRDIILRDLGLEDYIPSAQSSNQLADLQTKMNSAKTFANNNKETYPYYNAIDLAFFPAASACYAYSPEIKTGLTLDSRFGKNKWWLPSFGEMSRALYFQSLFVDTGKICEITYYMDELKDRSDNTTEVFPEYKTSDLNIFYILSKHNSLKNLFTKLDGTYWTSCEEGNIGDAVSTNSYQLSGKSNISEIKMVGADYEAGDVIPDTYESDEVVWSTLWTQCKKNNDFAPLGKWCMDELKDPNHDYYKNNRVYYYYHNGISMQDAIGYLSKATGTWHPYKSTKTKSLSMNLWSSTKNNTFSIRPICKF